MVNKKENQINNLIIESKQPKEMVAFYCDLNLVNSLDDFVHLTKKKLPANKKKKLNRSSVINMILRAVMDDYAGKKEESFLKKLILDWQDN